MEKGCFLASGSVVQDSYRGAGILLRFSYYFCDPLDVGVDVKLKAN